MRKKKFLLLLLCALMAAGCTSAAPSASTGRPDVSPEPAAGSAAVNTEFESYMDQYVIDVCEQSYLTAHHYFEHPEKAGIDLSKCKIVLGSVLPDQEEIDFVKKSVARLESFNPEDLSRSNRQIRQQLLWQLQISLDAWQERFLYLDNIWSSTSGVVSLLTDTFSEYQLFSEADIEPLLTLIGQIPDFVDEALEYSSVQARKNTLGFNLETVRESCQSILDSRDHSPITSELLAEVDTLMLDEASASQYKEQIRQALETSLFPSFERIITSLEALEPDNEGIKGLARYPDGKEYYQILLRSNSGSAASVEDLRSEIAQAMDDALEEYRKILRRNPEAVMEAENPKTRFDSIEDILPFLEDRYPAKFPVVETMNYEVKALSPEQSNPGIVAYFVVPPIDSSRPYEIRYNARDNTTDPDSLSLYDTFAHEGIPGHMYQTQYEREHFHHPVQHFLSSFGMQEGYATYAAAQTQEWSGVEPDTLRVYQLAELYSNYSILLMDLQVNYDGYSLKEFEETWGEGTAEIYERLAESPGVFFGYYYGCLKLTELQTIAREALGEDYDDVEFNNTILEAGNVEFGIVEENVQSYINSVRSRMYGENEPKGEKMKETSSQDEKPEEISLDSHQKSQDSSRMEQAEEEEMLEKEG